MGQADTSELGVALNPGWPTEAPLTHMHSPDFQIRPMRTGYLPGHYTSTRYLNIFIGLMSRQDFFQGYRVSSHENTN